MIITRILFKEAPTTEDQATIQTLFGDKYTPESTDTMYVYISSIKKSDVAKTLMASSLNEKIRDILITGSDIIVSPIEVAGVVEQSKESINGE
jgi:hypothetical protein